MLLGRAVTRVRLGPGALWGDGDWDGKGPGQPEGPEAAPGHDPARCCSLPRTRPAWHCGARDKPKPTEFAQSSSYKPTGFAQSSSYKHKSVNCVEDNSDSSNWKGFQLVVANLPMNKIRQFLSEPCPGHMLAAERVLKYLKRTLGHGLFYSAKADLSLSIFSDADWAACPDTRKSISGSAVEAAHGLIEEQQPRLPQQLDADADPSLLAPAQPLHVPPTDPCVDHVAEPHLFDGGLSSLPFLGSGMEFGRWRRAE
ncbi:hypothetical protein SASPL_145089 [Salvia splendens]|uniref:Uncharacterized protein n=1 Tax=Salvia splendens TaxID=180675 RepID=A0A8X8Z7U3_SALSN|nr:hypothetical protein SASPL_145089 [Salvia splendens]